MSNQERPKTTCFTCGQLVHKKRTHDFLKKIGEQYYSVKIFQCPECKTDTCALTLSDWKPRNNLQDNRLETSTDQLRTQLGDK